jgi:hypothetical protein
MGITIDDPNDEWIVVDSMAGGDWLEREFDTARLMVATVRGPCTTFFANTAAPFPDAITIAAPPSQPSGWHPEALVATDATSLNIALCTDLRSDPAVSLSALFKLDLVGSASDPAIPLIAEDHARSAAAILVAIETVLRGDATLEPEPDDSYVVDHAGDSDAAVGVPDPPPSYSPGDGSGAVNPFGGFFAGGESSTRQLDLRAGVAFLDPAPSDRETVTGGAAALTLPLRFVGEYVAVEGRGAIAYGGSEAVVVDAHAGAAIGMQWSGFSIAWAAGVGFADWDAIDPEVENGPHAYTGPVIKVGGDEVALELHSEFLLGWDEGASRLRADLATGRGKRKLVLGVERAKTGSAATVFLTAGVGLGLD